MVVAAFFPSISLDLDLDLDPVLTGLDWFSLSCILFLLCRLVKSAPNQQLVLSFSYSCCFLGYYATGVNVSFVAMATPAYANVDLFPSV
jgi:hypothetical protein